MSWKTKKIKLNVSYGRKKYYVSLTSCQELLLNIFININKKK